MRAHDFTRLPSACVLFFLVVAGCGGPEAAPAAEPGGGPPEPTAGGESGEAPAAENIPWDQRTPRQKAQFMNDVVVPNMKPLFQQFDSQRYARFGCPTCHGQNAREVQFRMPNALPALNPAEMPRPDSPDADQARFAPFMMQQVSPKMAELLGIPPYDPATGQGFGCFNCHPRRP